MIGRVALLVTFKKAKPKSQSLSRSHIRDLHTISRTLTQRLFFLADAKIVANGCLGLLEHSDHTAL